jgi:hypothetical protein
MHDALPDQIAPLLLVIVIVIASSPSRAQNRCLLKVPGHIKQNREQKARLLSEISTMPESYVHICSSEPNKENLIFPLGKKQANNGGAFYV